jgi:hypothetical protein
MFNSEFPNCAWRFYLQPESKYNGVNFCFIKNINKFAIPVSIISINTCDKKITKQKAYSIFLIKT